MKKSYDSISNQQPQVAAFFLCTHLQEICMLLPVSIRPLLGSFLSYGDQLDVLCRALSQQ